MQLDSALAVEHVKPKSLYPHLELQWSNFLLSCTNCNSAKLTKDVRLEDYYWPYIDNTTSAFVYLRNGKIEISDSLDEPHKNRAQKTLELFNLNKLPNYLASNRRIPNRIEAWTKAVHALDRLTRFDNPEMREQIIDTATANGYFSIWMTVFENDIDIRQRLIEAFPGTCRECFDPETKPVQRNPEGL